MTSRILTIALILATSAGCANTFSSTTYRAKGYRAESLAQEKTAIVWGEAYVSHSLDDTDIESVWPTDDALRLEVASTMKRRSRRFFTTELTVMERRQEIGWERKMVPGRPGRPGAPTTTNVRGPVVTPSMDAAATQYRCSDVEHFVVIKRIKLDREIKKCTSGRRSFWSSGPPVADSSIFSSESCINIGEHAVPSLLTRLGHYMVGITYKVLPRARIRMSVVNCATSWKEHEFVISQSRAVQSTRARYLRSALLGAAEEAADVLTGQTTPSNEVCSAAARSGPRRQYEDACVDGL